MNSPSSYYKNIANALTQAGIHSPTLVIDKQRLDQNIDHFLKVKERGFAFRLVAKSLPSVPFIKYIMQRTDTNRLMSFHLPFIRHVISHIPTADILLGKPMPVGGVKEFYHWHDARDNCAFEPQKQLHWLVDSNQRLKQYQALATTLTQPLNINLELDVGLHRGGFICLNQFKQALELIKDDPNLKLTGLMGYEAHISKIPGMLGGHKKAFELAMQSYQNCTELVAQIFGKEYLDSMILNAGGSSTYPLYQKPDIVNEIATASALVKPTDFDVFTLDHHQPAAFIATPILKMVDKPEIPMASGLSTLLRAIGLLPAQACFIYGGNWLASPCYPQDSKRANILGHSSNQEMFELKRNNDLSIDDYFFFRPSQSESVLLQFGQLAVIDNGQVSEFWPVFEA